MAWRSRMIRCPKAKEDPGVFLDEVTGACAAETAKLCGVDWQSLGPAAGLTAYQRRRRSCSRLLSSPRIALSTPSLNSPGRRVFMRLADRHDEENQAPRPRRADFKPVKLRSGTAPLDPSGKPGSTSDLQHSPLRPEAQRSRPLRFALRLAFPIVLTYRNYTQANRDAGHRNFWINRQSERISPQTGADRYRAADILQDAMGEAGLRSITLPPKPRNGTTTEVKQH